MQGECNSKSEKRSFAGLDTAEPKLILCKDNANERKRKHITEEKTMAPACRDAKSCVSRGRNALTGDMLLILHIGMGRT